MTSSKPEITSQRWLIAYNSISASLWSIVFFNTIFLSLSLGQPYFFDMTNKITTVIQCFAVIEIYNSATGNVKSPLFTTVTQVFSRLLIVIGICQVLPESPANVHWCFITLSDCGQLPKLLDILTMHLICVLLEKCLII